MLPEAHRQVDETAKELSLSEHTTKSSLKWLWMIAAFIVATAVAVGVAVGTWHRHKHSTHNSSSISNNSLPTPDHTSQVALGPILNDTSLAALALANGNRYLFFQDNTGLIRQAIRTPSNGQWSTSVDFNVGSSAKKYTPLAAAENSGGVSKRKPLNVWSLHVLTSE